MKDNIIRIRTDQEFDEKVDYLQKINGYKNKSDTIRRTVEKEYRREFVEPVHKPSFKMGEKEQKWHDELVEGVKYLEAEMKDINDDFANIPPKDSKTKEEYVAEYRKREKAKEDLQWTIRQLESGNLKLGE
jgi:hypothetical protein